MELSFLRVNYLDVCINCHVGLSLSQWKLSEQVMPSGNQYSISLATRWWYSVENVICRKKWSRSCLHVWKSKICRAITFSNYFM